MLIFVDDMLVYSKTRDEHDEHLKVVLQLLLEQNLYAKLTNMNSSRNKYNIWVMSYQRKE